MTLRRCAVLLLALAALALPASARVTHIDVLTRTPFLVVLLLEIGYAFFLNAQTSRVVEAVNSPSRDLLLLAELIARLEREEFHAPLLQQLGFPHVNRNSPPTR